jgi:hypothetical protein
MRVAIRRQRTVGMVLTLEARPSDLLFSPFDNSNKTKTTDICSSTYSYGPLCFRSFLEFRSPASRGDALILPFLQRRMLPVPPAVLAP